MPVLLKRDKEYRKKCLAERLLQRHYHLKDITPRPKNGAPISSCIEGEETGMTQLHSSVVCRSPVEGSLSEGMNWIKYRSV